MNAPTAMLLAAAGTASPAAWSPIEHAQMDSTLPWRDPDGAFVGLVATGNSWEITVDYNGAGGSNTGFDNQITWRTSGVGDVIPSRTGLAWAITTYAEVLTRVTTPPADASTWNPLPSAGILLGDADATGSIGGGLQCATSTSTAATSVRSDTRVVASSATSGRASITGIWPYPTVTSGASASVLYDAAGTIVAAATGISEEDTNAASGTSRIIVGLGNATNNPAAGNRTITVEFWLRIFDVGIANVAPWVDSTGWTSIPPTTATLSTDPNTLLSAFDTSASPEWRITIDDTGKTGPFDGFSEGILFTLAGTGVDLSKPFWLAQQVTNFPAYAYTQQFGFALGVVGVPTGWRLGPSPNGVAQAVLTTSDAPSSTTPFASGIGTVDFHLPKYDGVDLYSGPVFVIPNNNGTMVSNRAATSTAPASTTLTGLVATANKNTSTLGTSSAQLRVNVWFTQPLQYDFRWP